MTYGANGKDIKHSFTLSDGILNCILHMNASQCDHRIAKPREKWEMEDAEMKFLCVVFFLRARLPKDSLGG